MKKLRNFPTPPTQDTARIALQLLLDEEEPNEPRWKIDQARAWLKECMGRRGEDG